MKLQLLNDEILIVNMYYLRISQYNFARVARKLNLVSLKGTPENRLSHVVVQASCPFFIISRQDACTTKYFGIFFNWKSLKTSNLNSVVLGFESWLEDNLMLNLTTSK